MKKLHYVIFSKYRKFEKPKISQLLEKALFLSIICSKCKNEDEKIFKEEESIEILRKKNKIMNQEFRLKKIDEIRNYLIEEINQNELISMKHKSICKVLNYIEHSLLCNFCNYSISFYFCFCFFSWNFNRNYKFCNWSKNFYNNHKN